MPERHNLLFATEGKIIKYRKDHITPQRAENSEVKEKRKDLISD